MRLGCGKWRTKACFCMCWHMCRHMCWHMCRHFEESKRKRPHPDFAKKSTFRNGKRKNEFLVLQLGLKSTQVYIVRSCAEDGRGLLCKISARTGDQVRNHTRPQFESFPTIRIAIQNRQNTQFCESFQKIQPLQKILAFKIQKSGPLEKQVSFFRFFCLRRTAPGS